jgi:Predicted protease
MISLLLPAQLEAQIASRILQSTDGMQAVTLRNHHPQWANAVNSLGAVPAGTTLNELTLVLSRSPEQDAAFKQLLADQQNPQSPEYHHWLTPEEAGARFGASEADVAAVESWLQGQGLHVNWVSPSRIFVGFGGTAADVGRAFGAELRYYSVNGAQRMSIASEPSIPQALAPVIKSVRGLYSVDERPMLHSATVQSTGPELTSTAGNHYVTPADFAKIYDVPSGVNGAGVTIGIVSWAHTNFADFDNFRTKTGVSFPNPTEVVPTAFGGIDPGPAYTTVQTCTSCLDGQMEATLDVQRAGSTAPAASILLVVSSRSGSGGGIGADAQYLVNTSPVPAQVMSISFGGCEVSAGAPGVAYWDTLFQQAAAEGISVFVSSGDSGASGCDTAFSAPPALPAANSPNYICSSSYATCVGGTQFNDTSSPSTYWSSTNSTGYLSAYGYIPEGGWNESTMTSVAGSGGGVSTVIATPSWQTGTGVPAARTGRYTPDVSFASAGHDGYFGCMAAANGGCVGSPFGFLDFAGTSAAAPSMAGVAAMVAQSLGSAQGNMNPRIYAIAAGIPAAFHDATVASSGVSSCSVNTVSLCNNSAPSTSSLSGGQAGYLLTDGFDLVTGWGSLDVATFISNYSATSKSTPTVTVTASATSITTAQTLNVTVTVGGNPTPTGTITLTSGTYSSGAVLLSSGGATISIAAGVLPVGTNQLSAAYAPDSASSTHYNSASGTSSVTVTAVLIPGFTINGSAVTISAGASTGNTSTISITPVNGFTGSVSLTAALTSSPTGAANLPTMSFGATTPVNITGANAGTATLTITTTASQQGACTATNSIPQNPNWYARGGTVLACVLLFGFRAKRRKFRTALSLVALLIAGACGVSSCGGGSKSSTCTPSTIAGTTAGSYTFTVTGTSGTATATRTVALTVQ